MTSSSITHYSKRGSISHFMEEARTIILNFIIIASFLFTCYKFYKTFYGEEAAKEKSAESVETGKSVNAKTDDAIKKLQKEVQSANAKAEKAMKKLQKDVQSANEKAEKAMKKMQKEVQSANAKAENSSKELLDMKKQFAIMKEERNVGESKNAKECSLQVNKIQGIEICDAAKKIIWYIEHDVEAITITMKSQICDRGHIDEISLYCIVDALSNSGVKTVRFDYLGSDNGHVDTILNMPTAAAHLLSVLPQSEILSISFYDNGRYLSNSPRVDWLLQNNKSRDQYIIEEIYNKNGALIKGTGGAPKADDA